MNFYANIYLSRTACHKSKCLNLAPKVRHKVSDFITFNNYQGKINKTLSERTSPT